MKRKILTTVIAVAMAIGLVACGSTTKEDTKATTESTEEVETTETIESSTEAEEEKLTTEESTENAAEESTESATENAAENEAYTYADMSATMYATQTVNVRDLPDTSGKKVGGLKTNDEVTVTGQCNETGWYRISYGGGVAYVSNSYVASEKVAVQNNANSGAGNSAAGNNGGSASASASAPSGNNGGSVQYFTSESEAVAHATSVLGHDLSPRQIGDNLYECYTLDVYGYGVLFYTPQASVTYVTNYSGYGTLIYKDAYMGIFTMQFSYNQHKQRTEIIGSFLFALMLADGNYLKKYIYEDSVTFGIVNFVCT